MFVTHKISTEIAGIPYTILPNYTILCSHYMCNLCGVLCMCEMLEKCGTISLCSIAIADLPNKYKQTVAYFYFFYYGYFACFGPTLLVQHHFIEI